MKLDEVNILNYRSIKELTLKSDPSCQILVGINEAGKSNILNAIEYLSREKTSDGKDVRFGSKNENLVDESFIKFDVLLDKSDLELLYGTMKEKIYPLNSQPINIKDTKKLKSVNLFSVLEQHNHISVEYDFMKSKYYYHYVLPHDLCDVFECEDLFIQDKDFKEDESFSNKEEVDSETDELLNEEELSSKETKIPESKNVKIHSLKGDIIDKKYQLFRKKDIKQDDHKYLKEADINFLVNFIIDTMITLEDKLYPQLVFWAYNSEYLLPGSIDLKSFIKNPGICKPLESMFKLAGVMEIENQVNLAKERGEQACDNLLDRVAEKSTQYLRTVWKDYKNIEFFIKSNGDKLNIYIKDEENKYELEQRSDGFKRFITFLLMLSAKVSNSEIENAVIVIDEPDIGLHISGQKFLLKELLKISRKNIVFLSTHSIFMIDREYPSRHFKISKQKEQTTSEQVGTSDYTDDEVINNALGYSIFETLQKKNIVFEGWGDKFLFKTALNSKTIPKLPKDSIKELKNVGVVHSKGVKHITGIGKLLELANREYIVLSDSDLPAKEAKKRYLDEQKCVGKWFEYSDINSDVYTLEDFIKHSAFKQNISKLKSENISWKEFDFDAFENSTYRRLSLIEQWIMQNEPNKEKAKNDIKSIKEQVICSIKPTQIEEYYYDLLSEILKGLDL